jgi:hypothetical protein
MFRITYTQGNGYHCSCCRQEWIEHHDCETEQEVIEWLSELEACSTISEWSDDNDREVQEIREIKDDEIEFEADPKIVAKIIAERKAKKDVKKKKEEEKELQRKKDKLAQLKKELGEE